MRPGDASLAKQIEMKLASYSKSKRNLPGINSNAILRCLIEQIIDSIRRIKYVELIRDKDHSEVYTNPSTELFDPLKAASWHKKRGNLDEAFWLVFLAVHFGKNKKTGWNLVRETYKAAGNHSYATWNFTSQNFKTFREWLRINQKKLRASGNFGNHRKYQSLDAYSHTGTGMAIGSYIEWVGPDRSHTSLIQRSAIIANQDPKQLFDNLYKSMDNVISFGRTGKFDYLTMIGKLGLAPIEPKSTYMHGSTGPRSGASLLFTGSKTNSLSESKLNELLDDLENHLGLYFGMQVLEDALCNWQKSPGQYIYFNG